MFGKNLFYCLLFLFTLLRVPALANTENVCKVQYPSGGEVFKVGDTVKFLLSPKAISLTPFTLQLWDIEKCEWLTICDTLKTESGSFSWLIAPEYGNVTGRLRLVNNANTAIYSMSAGYIQIDAQPLMKHYTHQETMLHQEKCVIAPNPAQNTVHLLTDEKIISPDIYVYDYMGKQYILPLVEENTMSITHLQNGFYFAVIILDSGLYKLPFFVQR